MQMETFGSRLRTARRRLGMSQVDVGGDRYSGSYVSHLESGRRQPTIDIAEHLATQMHVPLAELLGGDASHFQVTTAERTTLVHDLSARAAWREHDFTRANADAERAATAALGSHRMDSWWAATSLRAHSMLALGEYTLCWELAEMLAGHEVAAGSGAMRAEMLVLAAKARRSRGQLSVARARAEDAIAFASQPPGAQTPLALAYMEAIAAVADLGLAEEATLLADRLRVVREHVDSRQVRGQIAWSLGNLDYLVAKDLDRGQAEHRRAEELLRPEADLRAWARFRSASSRVQLAAGIIPGARERLDQAATVLPLVGDADAERELEMGYAELAYAEGDYDLAIVRVEAALAPPCPLPDNQRAEAELTRARSLRRLTRTVEAQQSLLRAATMFENSGALQRATQALKLHAELSDPVGWGQVSQLASGASLSLL